VPAIKTDQAQPTLERKPCGRWRKPEVGMSTTPE
jgi:hypothetical protein